MVFAYGAAGGNAVQAQIGTLPGTEQLFYLLLVILISDNLIRPHILPNRLNDKE
jgi:hypothetical protein